MSTYEIGSIVFDKWKICRELGQGSYGTVYEIQREDFGGVYRAALKVITVPQSRTELQSVLDEGMTPPQAKQYFYSVVEASAASAPSCQGSKAPAILSAMRITPSSGTPTASAGTF